MAALKDTYKKDVVPQLMKEFGYSSIMEVPKLTQIVLNMGLGEAVQVGSESCPECGVGTVALRDGRDGAFYGCSEFPACGYGTKG